MSNKIPCITITYMHSEFSRAVRVLVARFGGQRPVRAGSLIVTLFGDAILPRGGAVSLGSLIKLAAPFGLNERLVRTAASRLVHDGWLAAHRSGKLSEYHLSAAGRDRFDEATQRIYGAPSPAWSGRWSLVVLPQLPGPKRKRIRENLSWLGFGEFAAGVFAHPQLPGQTLEQIHRGGEGRQSHRVRGPFGGREGRSDAGRSWMGSHRLERWLSALHQALRTGVRCPQRRLARIERGGFCRPHTVDS